MTEPTPGQKFALHQLAEIAARSKGALSVLGDAEEIGSGGLIRIRLSLETKPYRTGKGFEFRNRERLLLLIDPDFPFKKPDLYFEHKRFLGYPHVQWGKSICLYQSAETEYDPSDGLFGFFNRVDVWMKAAGSGQLDPDDAPLHPPVTYVTASTVFVAKADAPVSDTEGIYWIGRADVRKIRDDRYDIEGWTHLNDWQAEDTQAGAAAILFDRPLATEYPEKVNDLIKLVEKAGLDFGMLYKLLRLYALLTPKGEPAYFVLGAPMRRKAQGEPLRPHLTVWQIDPEALGALRALVASGDDTVARDKLVDWMVKAKVRWCQLMEERPEIVRRRDAESLLSAIAGKRVLLLGCGALGSAVGEMLVRAGAGALHLADSGVVKPGILVRQRYADSDIGLLKSQALHARLSALGLSCAITHEPVDLAARALARFPVDRFDLVIDATASVRVAHRIERELRGFALSAPLLTMTVSAAADHGCMSVRMPGYRGGPHRIARQAKLKVMIQAPDHPLAKAFWPAREDVKIFQPEPGCSAPTFLGSAADIDHHAAALLNLGLLRARELKPEQASIDLVGAPWLPAEAGTVQRLSYVFAGRIERSDRRHGYLVLQSEKATRGMKAEIRRIARAKSDRVETGGLLFGEIDDSHGYIWIDGVSGPPPDSVASPEKFICGTAGTKELAGGRAKSSGGSSRFIGIWHSHPVSRGSPSNDDLQAMDDLLFGQERPPRHVLMLIVGFAATMPEFNDYLFRRDEFYGLKLLQAAAEAQP